MSEDAQNQETTQVEESAAPSAPPVGEPQRGLETSGLKFGDEVQQSWARGKTAQEVLDMADQMYAAIQTNSYQPAQPQPVQHVPTPAPVQEGQIDPNLIYTDPARYQQLMLDAQKTQTQQYLDQQAQPLINSNIELAKAEAKRNPDYKEVWDKFGPEIELEARAVAPQAKMSPSFWNNAAALVKGRHAEDLFKARLSATQTDTGTFGAGGDFQTGNSSSFASPLQQAWSGDEDWIQQYKRLPGMTLSKLQEKVQSMGWTEADYVAANEKKTAMSIHRSDDELSRHGVN